MWLVHIFREDWVRWAGSGPHLVQDTQLALWATGPLHLPVPFTRALSFSSYRPHPCLSLEQPPNPHSLGLHILIGAPIHLLCQGLCVVAVPWSPPVSGKVPQATEGGLRSKASLYIPEAVSPDVRGPCGASGEYSHHSVPRTELLRCCHCVSCELGSPVLLAPGTPS